MIKLADTLAPMADFPAVEAQHVAFEDGDTLQDKLDNGALGGGGASYIEKSQADYDALSDDEKLNGKEYRTYDTGHIYKRGVEYGKDVDTGTKGLRSNSQYFKIDITKNGESWNGTAKLSFNNSTTPTEVTFTITADKVYYTITEGTNCIKSVTYTIDTVNVTIGVELNGVVYGTQMVEMNTTFGAINSLTNEEFTGANTATQIGVDLELAKGKKVVTTLGKGTWMIGQRIKQDTDFTVTDAQASFEVVTKNASSATNGKYQTAQLYQLTPITDGGTNASLSLNVCEDGRAQVTVWPHTKDMPPNDYNIVCEGHLNSKLGSKQLVTNAQNFKIVLAKNNAVWYGMFTFNFVYGTTPCEITVAITDKVYYTITKGQNLVSAITYTQDGAKYTIGLDLTAKVYGTQVVDMPSEFGTINSLTAETFAGTTSAVSKGYGFVTTTDLNMKSYSKPSQLGLSDTSCTTVELVQAIRNKANNDRDINYIGIFDSYDYAVSDAPSRYGLLHVEARANDRLLIRYDGINGSSHDGSWIGKIIGNNSTFSGIKWDRVDNTFNGKTVKSVEVDLSASAFQNKNNTNVKLTSYIGANANIIKAEGYVNTPDGYGHLIGTSWGSLNSVFKGVDGWYFMAKGYGDDSTKKNTGFMKLYYIE